MSARTNKIDINDLIGKPPFAAYGNIMKGLFARYKAMFCNLGESSLRAIGFNPDRAADVQIFDFGTMKCLVHTIVHKRAGNNAYSFYVIGVYGKDGKLENAAERFVEYQSFLSTQNNLSAENNKASMTALIKMF